MRNTILSRVAKPQTTDATPVRRISLEEEIQANVDQIEAVAEMEKTGDEINHAEDAIAVLEELAVIVNEIDKPTPTESALIQLTGDALAAGTDADPNELTPSMEDENGTKTFKEKASDVIRKIIEAVRAAIRKIGEMVKKFTTSTNTVILGKAQRSKELREMLRGVKLQAPIQVQVSGSKLFDKDMNVTEVTNRLKETFKALEQYQNFMKKTENSVQSNMKDNVKALKDLSEGRETNYSIGIVPVIGKATGEKKKLRDINVATYDFEIPNTGLHILNYGTTGSVKIKDMDDMSAFVTETTMEFMHDIILEDRDTSEVKTVTINSAADLEAGLAVVDASLKSLLDINKSLEDAVKGSEEALKLIEQESESMIKMMKEENASIVGSPEKTISSVTNFLRKVVQRFSASSSRLVKVAGSLEATYLTLTAEAIQVIPQTK